jgi:hypothetical protein
MREQEQGAEALKTSTSQDKKSSACRRGVSWIAQWGFAVLVAVAVLAAAYVAWKVSIPAPVPDFALRAEAVYRIEVGASTFMGLYVLTMALVLALNNRGFSEIGVNGLKAQDMANKAQQDAIQSHEKSLEILGGTVDEIGVSTEASIRELQARFKTLEDDAKRDKQTTS